MFEVWKRITGSPVLIVLGLLCILMLFFGVANTISNIATYLGMETKENVTIKLAKTNIELEKLVAVNEKNESEDKLKEELQVNTGKVVNEIKIKEDEEDEELQNIYNTIDDVSRTELESVDEARPTTIDKPPTIVKEAYKANTEVKKAKEIKKTKEVQVVKYEVKSEALSNSQSYAISMIMQRHHNFKGLK